MKASRFIVLFVMLLSCSVMAFAADPDPVTENRSGEAGTEPAVVVEDGVRTEVVPDLDINQAELEMLSSGGLEEGEFVLFGSDDGGEIVDLPTAPTMMDEIRTTMETTRIEALALQERVATASDESAAMALQRQVEQLFQDCELQILAIQAGHARNAGKLELAGEIEAAMVAMTAPRPVEAPQERPAPDSQLH